MSEKTRRSFSSAIGAIAKTKTTTSIQMTNHLFVRWIRTVARMEMLRTFRSQYYQWVKKEAGKSSYYFFFLLVGIFISY